MQFHILDEKYQQVKLSATTLEEAKIEATVLFAKMGLRYGENGRKLFSPELMDHYCVHCQKFFQTTCPETMPGEAYPRELCCEDDFCSPECETKYAIEQAPKLLARQKQHELENTPEYRAEQRAAMKWFSESDYPDVNACWKGHNS